MSNFLLFVAVPEDHAALVERIVKSAICFLEASGKVAHTDLGAFRRIASKGKAIETMKLARFASDAVEADHAASTSRSLEGVLRSTLASAGVAHGDVRVFVADESASPRSASPLSAR